MLCAERSRLVSYICSGGGGLANLVKVVTCICVNLSLHFHAIYIISVFQRAKLYYDPDLGSYYQYDDQLKTYTLHSRVDLPECQMRRKQPEKEVEIILIDEDELSGQLFSWIFNWLS